MQGSTYRRCYCRDDDGRPLGTKCPRLTSKRHGVWSLKQELPARQDGSRRAFHRGGYENAGKAQTDLDKVRAILDVPAEDDLLGQRSVGDLLESVSKVKGTPIPDLAEVKRRFATDDELGAHTTVAQWLTEWIEDKGGRPTSIQRDRDNIRLHLIPHLGERRLDRLRVRHLREMFEAIAERSKEVAEQNEQRRDAVAQLAVVPLKGAENRARRAAMKAAITEMPPFGRPVGPASFQRIRSTLRAALNDAMRQQRHGLAVNVAALLELDWKRPKGVLWSDEHVKRWRGTGEKPSTVMVWTPDQAGQFLTYMLKDRLYAMYHLIAFRGLRRGEACAVRWVDVDLRAGTLTVATSLVENGWEVYEDKPKTESGARTISLDSGTVKALARHRMRQRRERRRMGSAWVDTGRVFVREDGTWLRPSDVSAAFTWAVRCADMPPVRLHDLRHGAATIMHASGGDMHYIKSTLGHSSIAITSDTYTNLLPQLDQAIAERAVGLVPIGGTSRTLGHATVTQTLAYAQSAEPDEPRANQ